MPSSTQKKPYKIIGTRPIRPDGVDKVTGRARYGGDVKLSGLLHGVTVRSPHAHANIKSIDTSKALALPGVHAVITSADVDEIDHQMAELGEGMFDLHDLCINVMARNKVLYHGHSVAAVVAENIHIAQEAAKLVEVEYEVLPHVMDVQEAMRDDAPILFEDLRTESHTGEKGDKPSNIAKQFRFEKGDIKKGFEEATTIIEREFTTSTVHQGYIEPHNVTAHWNADGHITIWTSTQGSFTVREQLAGLLQLPLSHIKVVPMEIGGGFGGKICVYQEPIAAILSKKTGRPVKMVMNRKEVLQATGPTPGSYMKVKMGVDSDNKLTAVSAEIVFEAGAHPGSPVAMGCMCTFACYDIPNGLVDGFDVVLNRPATKAYRAPGSTQVAYAVESVINELCEQLEIDPLEFRLNNAAVEGTERIDGPVYARIGMWETVDAIKKSEHWKSPKTGKHIGRGVASGFWFNAGLKSSVSAAVNPDGTVALTEGSTDIGGSRASIAMQFAETLDIPMEDVVPTIVDTDTVGYNDVTGGSRVTYATGWAAYEAARAIKKQMLTRAADLWDVPLEKVTYEEGLFKAPENHQMTFKEMAAEAFKAGDPIVGNGTSNHNEPGGAFGTHVVDVEVDIDTGKVQILRYTAAQDVGTAIHPSYVEGQLQGGVVQGIGWALNEEYIYDAEGHLRNDNFLDYRMPTCYDVPMIDTILIEVPNPGHPYGVRGVGEVPIVPPPAAIAAAIYDATGIRMTHLPMSPPRLLHELLSRAQ